MKTLAQAIKMAEEVNGGPVDHCTEYWDAWVLVDSSVPEMIGGMKDGCYVVMKTLGGPVMNFTGYLYKHNFKIGEPKREVDITEEDRKG